jgi:shikimate dehydrogenase
MKVFCILSDKRAFKSKSPVMHTAVLKHHGIQGIYVPFSVEPARLGEAVRGLSALNIAGANVTVPYKEMVLPYLDSVAAEASAVGAVNTICRDGDSLVGHNTDVGGFMDTVKGTGFDPAGKSALVIGTGGVARAIVYALARLDTSHIMLAGRDPDKARIIALKHGAETIPMESLSRDSLPANLVVNATSVSSSEEGPKLADRVGRLRIPDCKLVIDANYGRKTNFWKEMATAVTADFVDGLPMLAHQAKRSFTLWTGLQVEATEFMNELKEH